ncbi:serine hydrolase domain-containing protein [Amorphus orientalis]|uniref:CubicO group peptidase (Beta-lactamase class C family) n=1 Tax=Amorphus orientalis TaxID=649198 RepID=A0AAE3VQV2_9HYPH|nr:serine hydrolase domain-containing protein [Amorphus orientalis]MDQ0316501.1 CubicO group peptidase (beta-lactamase class C family) [Amorphus orientalis]
MKRIGYGLALGFLIATAPAAVAMDDVASILEPIRESQDVPALAGAVTKNGEIIAAGVVGTRVYGMDIPVELDDRFHLGSDTKAMTATIAGQMVEDGLISWDSTVGDVLGEDIEGMSPEFAAVTLAQLLSHSSGIPTDTEEMMEIYFSTEAFDFTPQQRRLRAIDAWKRNVPKVPEGSPFQYANFGYMTAGAMLEKVSGRPWEELIVSEIFDPLELETAGLGATATPGRYDAPVGHRLQEDGTVQPMAWGISADMPPLLGPAGLAHMSILDFARWADWNAAGGARGPELITPETLAELHREHVRTPHRENPPPGTPGDGGYGFGWGVVEFDFADHPVLTHNGSNGMNLAKILVDLEQDLGIVVTTNVAGQRGDLAAAQALEKLYRAYGVE